MLVKEELDAIELELVKRVSTPWSPCFLLILPEQSAARSKVCTE